MRSVPSAGSLALQCGNVGTIDYDSALSVEGSNGTVPDETVGENALESGLTGATNHAVQFASVISLCYVPLGEE